MSFEVIVKDFEAFVGVNPFTLVFAWINILILYLFLRKLLFNPVKNMIDSRQKEIDDMYADAEDSKKDADIMRSEYEDKLSKANEESEEILKRAVRKAQLREEEIIKNAGEEAKHALERARQEAELEKKRALNEIKDEVSGMALGIAAAVIERDISEDEHKAFIDDFIRDIGDEK